MFFFSAVNRSKAPSKEKSETSGLLQRENYEDYIRYNEYSYITSVQ